MERTALQLASDNFGDRLRKVPKVVRDEILRYAGVILSQEKEIKKLRAELYGDQNEPTDTRIESRIHSKPEIMLPSHSCINFYPSPFEFLNYIQCRQHEMADMLDVRSVGGRLLIRTESGNHIQIKMENFPHGR